MGTELNNNIKKSTLNGKLNGHCSEEILPDCPQMALEIQNYEAPPGAEKHHLVKLEDLERYIKTMQKSGGFKKQFQMLQATPHKSWNVGNKPENKQKNRYPDLLPYDESRVVLQQLKNDPNSDYINASYIDGYNKKKCYICAQGPLSNTVADFWRMIWQEDVNIIAMMANIIEIGKKKCEKYWPDKSLKATDITVTFQSESCFLDYTIRTFKLQKASVSGTRFIRQYQYTAWPDHSVPSYPLSLISMLQDIKNYQKTEEKETPWVVHCSAGVGRSGTVMLLDAAIQMSQAEQKIDVFGLLYQMRQQRISLIGNVEQFTFVYKALVEYHFGDVTSKPANEMVLYFNKLRQQNPETKKTGLEMQFERLRSLDPPNFQQKCLVAATESNMSKNRDMYILPPDDGRPVLKTNPPSNYINAVYAYDYGKQNHFVVTQFPLPNTVADFWQMVWDTGSFTIVVLNEINSKDQTSPVFWPTSGSMHQGSMKLEHLASDAEYFSGVLTRKIKIKNIKGKSRTIKMFHLHGWRREDFVPPEIESIVQLIAKVDRWKSKNKQAQTIVTCYDGSRASGFYCAASYLIGEIWNTQQADVVQAVRTVRLHRPAFIPTQEQYRWLYELACFLVSEKKIIRDK